MTDDTVKCIDGSAVTGCSKHLTESECGECTNGAHAPNAAKDGCEACAGGSSNVLDHIGGFKKCVDTVHSGCSKYADNGDCY